MTAFRYRTDCIEVVVLAERELRFLNILRRVKLILSVNLPYRLVSLTVKHFIVNCLVRSSVSLENRSPGKDGIVAQSVCIGYACACWLSRSAC